MGVVYGDVRCKGMSKNVRKMPKKEENKIPPGSKVVEVKAEISKSRPLTEIF